MIIGTFSSVFRLLISIGLIPFIFVSSLDVLVTRHSDLVQWTCFGTSSSSSSSSSPSCCEEIERTLPILEISTRIENCRELLAEVPKIPLLSKLLPRTGSSFADFSLVIPSSSHHHQSTSTSRSRNNNNNTVEEKEITQYLWKSEKQELTPISSSSSSLSVPSPFVLNPSSFSSEDTEEKDYDDGRLGNIESTLSNEGGMHRVMTTKIHDNYPNIDDHEDHNYYLHGDYLVIYQIPEGLFVDLDDFVIVDDDDDDDDDSKRKATVYSAKVCDIEKTAFVGSGQHVVILQLPALPINKEGRRTTTTTMIQTKWHLRYPKPVVMTEGRQGSLIQNLISPQVLLLLSDPGNNIKSQNGDIVKLIHSSSDPTVSSAIPDIWVAAGYDRDYYIVMWATIFACCVGVLIMLRDIALVSYWD